MRIEKVVVGIDFSPASMDAVCWVAKHFAPDAEIILAYVVHIPASGIPWLTPPTGSLEVAARDGARRRLIEAGEVAGARRFRVEVRRGEPARTLCRIADDFGADLLVVGAHRERGGFREWLGSTAERVLGSARVPVLLAANARHRVPRHVLAAVDGSEISDDVAAWATALGRRFDAPHVRLTAVSSVSTGVLAAAGPGDAHWAAGPERASTRGWQEGVEETAFGEPSTEILAAADRHASDVIVVGRCRSSGRARRALFGSVANAVLRGASCPVLVVVEPSQDSQETHTWKR